VALPSTLARLLLSFLPGQAIPNLLGVSHAARWLCACLHDLDMSLCRDFDDFEFLIVAGEVADPRPVGLRQTAC